MTSDKAVDASGRSWQVEHRYRAVLEVRNGSPVVEVALRYGASRQSVYTWKARYELEGLAGLEERSRRPHHSPHRLAAEIEALVCELRRSHRRWGARRLVFELARRGVTGVPSQATVHRALVRNGLVQAEEQHHPRKYKRWQRETPMHLWQLDLVGGLYLADGREFKLLTGIDDHSRYVVVAAVLAVPNGRAVCEAFTVAMHRYGVPSEVLTDNGKQFTGRFTKPMPAEVLFERVCREHGITALLTKPRSPTTTGKIERFHQTLRRELLDEAGPFADLPAAQAAVDAWVHAYNHVRPHQSLNMATPASLFQPRQQQPHTSTAPATGPAPGPTRPAPLPRPPAASTAPLLPAGVNAVEFDTVIAASGVLNVLPRAQRVKLGLAHAGQLAHVWADEHSVHVLIGGQHVRTVPSSLSTEDIHELRLRGAVPAGPPPANPATRNRLLPAGAAVEVDRTVNADGSITLGGHALLLGAHLAGRRVTVRLDGHLVHVVADGALAKTLPSPIPVEQRGQLRGARLATGQIAATPIGPIQVERRVPADGVVMITRQRIRVGRTHAGKIVTIFVEDTHFRVVHNGEDLALHPRLENRPVTRFRAYGTTRT
ncbi:IS481 family transposase [Dactylosporangium sp. NBC_01737]|uniref:IS481 family transposase n=1 Tax=Dactylosporangium sp. NBC_01737 TaxID=2975959 RepID=UPI002E0F77CC|nr:IS481 family transposase [Dactylosporangium sp. NBC_01737]